MNEMTIKCALDGYNALTDTDPRHFSLIADSDNILIKEFARGSITVGSFDDGYVEHNLNYPPKYIAYVETSSGVWEWVNGYNIYSEFNVYATSTRLYFVNSSLSSRNFKYYIFYDNEDNG